MRLLLNISAHGFGHLTQVAPVVRALKDALPNLQVLARTALPPERVQFALGLAASIVPTSDDFGVPMRNAYAPDAAAALAAWRDAAAQSEYATNALANFVQRERCDFVISAISPWPLLAARKANVPGFGVGSFVWTDILERLGAGRRDLRRTLDSMSRAYKSASALFRLTPGLSMRGLDSLEVPPVSAGGVRRRTELIQSLNADSETKIILLAFGGMLPNSPPALVAAPKHNWKIIGPSKWVTNGLIDAEALGLPFADLVASADLIISKPGYGIGIEVAHHQAPCIMAPRADWPEDEAIMAWLKNRAPLREARSLSEITASLVAEVLDDEELSPLPTHTKPEGGEHDIADAILNRLGIARAQ